MLPEASQAAAYDALEHEIRVELLHFWAYCDPRLLYTVFLVDFGHPLQLVCVQVRLCTLQNCFQTNSTIHNYVAKSGWLATHQSSTIRIRRTNINKQPLNH